MASSLFLAPQSEHLDLLDAGIGSSEIIFQLRARTSPVTHLTLGHNNLGDDGIAELCEFFMSSEGAALRLESLSVNTTAIGDDGLRALGSYIAHPHCSVRELYIQNNLFSDPDALSFFAYALNKSRLRHLLLSSNSLGDSGASAFLDVLAAPRLIELHLSAVGLGPASVQTLSKYLSSPRSAALRILRLNGNRLGDLGEIFDKALEHSNWWLEDLEAFANDWPSGQTFIVPTGALVLRRHVTTFRAVLGRNKLLRLETRKNALTLLRLARVLLLHPRPATSSALILHRDPHVRKADDGITVGSAPIRESTPYFAWLSLPYELRIHVLRFIVPSSILSPSQHVRVCLYAERLTTVYPKDVEEWLYDVGCAWFEPHADMFRG